MAKAPEQKTIKGTVKVNTKGGAGSGVGRLEKIKAYGAEPGKVKK